jgi:hypothetical protein
VKEEFDDADALVKAVLALAEQLELLVSEAQAKIVDLDA